MKNALASAIKSAVKGKRAKAMEDDEPVNADGDEEEVVAEGEDEDVDAEGNDDEMDAEGDDEEVNAEGDEEEKPAARGKKAKPSADTLRERERCIAIVTHANADEQPKLTAKLLVNGTPKGMAVDMLNDIEPAAHTGSLGSRHRASQGNKRPGVDGKDNAKVFKSEADKSFVSSVRQKQTQTA